LGESANELVRGEGKAVRLAKRGVKNRAVAGMILPPEAGSSKQESKRL